MQCGPYAPINTTVITYTKPKKYVHEHVTPYKRLHKGIGYDIAALTFVTTYYQGTNTYTPYNILITRTVYHTPTTPYEYQQQIQALTEQVAKLTSELTENRCNSAQTIIQDMANCNNDNSNNNSTIRFNCILKS
jgi:hypothetical protein